MDAPSQSGREMNGDRAAILGRIREALRSPAPRHHDRPDEGAGGKGAVTAPFREWLPPTGATVSEYTMRFAELSEMLRTEFVLCPNLPAAANHLRQLAMENGWKRLALHSGDLNDAIVRNLPPALELVRLESNYDRSLLESCDAGLTECDCLVAQTGSVCVTTRSAGGRTLSVLPPHHLVIARQQQLVPDLMAAYELLAQKYAPNYPSFISFISGPSRTGDIERILVLGAHGPRKLTVLLLT
jgi:L-lactate dehydrogenase complex protein LldG